MQIKDNNQDPALLSQRSISVGLALAVACIVNALIVIVKEKSNVVMNGMKTVTGHHWITHTVIVLVVFGLFAWIFGRANGGQGVTITVSRLIRTIVSGVVTSGLVIIGFYLFAD